MLEFHTDRFADSQNFTEAFIYNLICYFRNENK
jgi:hypothetical protein